MILTQAVSTAYWAFGCKSESLEAAIKAIEYADAQKNQNRKKEAILGLVHFIADYGRKDLKALGIKLLDDIREDTPGLETKGFFMIKIFRPMIGGF